MSSILFISNLVTMSKSQPEVIWSRCRAIVLFNHHLTSQEHTEAPVMMSGVFTTVLRLENSRPSSSNLALWQRQMSLWAHLSLGLARNGVDGLMRFHGSCNSLHSKLLPLLFCSSHCSRSDPIQLLPFPPYKKNEAQRRPELLCYFHNLLNACLPAPKHLRPSTTQALSVGSLGWVSGLFNLCLSLSGQLADSVLAATSDCLLCASP